MAIIGETSEQRQERENVKDELRRKSERLAEETGEPREYIDQFTTTQPFLRKEANSGPKNAKVPKRSGGNGPADKPYYPPKITK